MVDVGPEASKPLWWKRRWVTLSEAVGVGALLIAALSLFESHRVRREDVEARRGAVRQEAQRRALVLRGQPVDNGARMLLTPLSEAQAVQSQRYLFPHAVLGHAMQIDAEPPQVQVAWLRDGLAGELRAAAEARHVEPRGDGRLPVGVVTTYVEDGETRVDRALYLVGYRATPGGLFGGGPRVFLRGLELVRRGEGADLQARVEARWAAEPRL